MMDRDTLVEAFRLAHKASANAHALSVVGTVAEALESALAARDAWASVACTCSAQLASCGLMESAQTQVLGESDE